MANVLGTLFGDIANAIREKSGESGTMKPAEFPAKIAAIPAGGGGSAAGAVTVSFCNYDGTEIYSRQVFIGDDCPDPVAQRKIDAPTKESTAQYKYTHDGWSTTAGGAADANALKNITANKTVYASFAATVREYTVRFLDGDTVMKTEQVAYGSKATPPDTTKDGHVFSYWTPNDLTVRGDTDFVGTWVEAAYTLIDTPTDLKTDVYGIAAHPLNNNIALLTSDSILAKTYLNVYDTDGETFQLLFSVDTQTTTNRDSIAYNPDGTRLALYDYNTGMQIYDATTTPYTLIDSFKVNFNVRSIAYSPDGTKLFVGCETGYFVTFDVSQIPAVSIDNVLSWGYAYAVNCIRYNPDKTILALGSVVGKVVSFYDTTTTPYTLLTTYSYDSGVYDIEFSTDGKECVVCTMPSAKANIEVEIAYLYHINGKSIVKSDQQPFKYLNNTGKNKSISYEACYHPNGGKIVFFDTFGSGFVSDNTLFVYNAHSYTVVNDMFIDPPDYALKNASYNRDGSRFIMVNSSSYMPWKLRIYNTEIDML